MTLTHSAPCGLALVDFAYLLTAHQCTLKTLKELNLARRDAEVGCLLDGGCFSSSSWDGKPRVEKELPPLAYCRILDRVESGLEFWLDDPNDELATENLRPMREEKTDAANEIGKERCRSGWGGQDTPCHKPGEAAGILALVRNLIHLGVRKRFSSSSSSRGSESHVEEGIPPCRVMK